MSLIPPPQLVAFFHLEADHMRALIADHEQSMGAPSSCEVRDYQLGDSLVKGDQAMVLGLIESLKAKGCHALFHVSQEVR